MFNNFFSNLFKKDKNNIYVPPGTNPTNPNQFNQPKVSQPAGYQGGSLYVPAGLKPYQIRTSDTFEKIAEANKMSVQDLQQANGGMLVPPPKGSYINLPYKTFTPTVPGMNTQLLANQSRGAGANSFTSGGNVNLTELTANINTQLTNGQLPSSIPFQITKTLINPTTGQLFTDADYRASGYVYNNIKQTYEMPGASSTSNQPAQQTANQPAYLQTVNYNGKSMPAWEAELRMRRAARKERQRLSSAVTVETPLDATNSGGLPATTLDVAIGGG